jgi:hypothetical protein
MFSLKRLYIYYGLAVCTIITLMYRASKNKCKIVHKIYTWFARARMSLIIHVCIQYKQLYYTSNFNAFFIKKIKIIRRRFF